MKSVWGSVAFFFLSIILTAFAASSTSALYDIPNENKFEWELLDRSTPGRYFGFYNEYIQSKKKPEKTTYEMPLPGITDKSYLCVIPYTQNDDVKESSEQQSALPVEDYLLPLDTSPCIYRWEGWWSYELCFGKHVRQYHQEKEGAITAEFYLGKSDDSVSGIAGETGFSEIYNDGTICDLTQNPRTTRVIYRCNPSVSTATFAELREPSTCNYDLYVDSPSLCLHPKYKPPKVSQSLKVNCFETPLPDTKELETALETYNLKTPNALKTKTTQSQPRKPTARDAEKSQYINVLQSRFHVIGLPPKFLGADFIEHLYNIFGSTRTFNWATRTNILALQYEFRLQKLEERLAELGFSKTLENDEIVHLISMLPDGKNAFDWLTKNKLEEALDFVSKKKAAALTALEERVLEAADVVMQKKGLDIDVLTNEDLGFLVNMIEQSRIDSDNLETEPSFLVLYDVLFRPSNIFLALMHQPDSRIDLVLALTPKDLERRRAALEFVMREYGVELAELGKSQVENVLRIGRVAFEVIQDDGRRKLVFADLDKVKTDDADLGKTEQDTKSSQKENDEL